MIPVKAHDRVIGVMCLDCAPGDAARALGFDVPLLERLVASSAVAVINARAYDQVRSDLAELTSLHQAAQRINASVTPHALLAALEQAARQVVEAAVGAFRALRPAAGERDPVPVRGSADLGGGLVARGAGGSARKQADSRAPWRGCASPPWRNCCRAGPPRARRLVAAAPAPPGGQRGERALPWPAACAPRPRPSSCALLAAIFSHGAAALRHTLDHQQMLRRQSLELTALYDLSEAASSATSPQAALESVLDFARSLIPYDRAAVLTWNGERSGLELEAGRGFDTRRLLAGPPRAGARRRDHLGGARREDLPVGGCRRCRRRLGAALRHGAAAAHRQPLHRRARLPQRLAPGLHGAAGQGALRGGGAGRRHLPGAALAGPARAATRNNILRSIVAGVIGLDHAGRIVMWSPMAQAILRHPADQAVGRLFDAVVDEIARREQAPALTALSLIVRKVMQSGVASTGHELGLRATRSLSVSCSPLRSGEDEPPGAVVLVEDVTERRELEERMLRVNQLATIGHLAANVAHEVRNPLSAIKTAAQFLQSQYSSDEVAGQFAGIINSECDRLTKVTTDFLVYARPPSPHFEPVRLEDVIERSLQLIGARVRGPRDPGGVRLPAHAAHPAGRPRGAAAGVPQPAHQRGRRPSRARGEITLCAQCVGEQGPRGRRGHHQRHRAGHPRRTT